MTEEKEGQASANETWEEVGQQFRALGESLASAFKTTWESEETRQHLEKMETGLESIVEEISQAAQKMADSAEAQKVKAEAEKAAHTAQTAGQQTVKEIRPQLLAAFRKIRTELDQMIKRMEAEEQPDPETTGGESGSASEPAE
jgi:uncharacterized membrane protein YccC